MQLVTELLVPLQVDLTAFAGTLQNIVAFIVVFGMLVFFHELGHFLVAKLNGVRVHEFALGFGPAVVQKRWGETLYAIRVIPLGGFVKLAGMEPTENLPEALAGTDEDGERAFHRKSPLQRMSILAAGPVMNFVLAILIYAALFMTLAVSVVNVYDGLPADRGGLRPGDLIVGINGESVRGLNAGELIRRIQAAGEAPVRLEIVRNGVTEHLEVTPTIDPERGVPILGVELTMVSAGIQQGVVKSLIDGVKYTGSMIRTFFFGISEILTGREPAKLSGPIGIFQLTGVASQAGLLTLLQLTALLSINIAIFNLLPIPILDGGGLLFVLIEMIRRRPLSARSKGIAQMIGLSLLLLLLIFATIQDVENFRS